MDQEGLNTLLARLTGLNERFDFAGKPVPETASPASHLGLYVRETECAWCAESEVGLPTSSHVM